MFMHGYLWPRIVTSSIKQAALTKQWMSPTTTQTSLQTMKEKIVSIANHDSMYNFSLRFCTFNDEFILIIVRIINSI